MTTFVNTPKQREIMHHVCEAAARGRHITFRELLAILSYKPSRSAMHCSIRFLKGHGFLTTTNHSRNSGFIIPTAAGFATFKAKPLNL